MGKRQSFSEHADAGNVGYRIQDHDFRADEGRIRLALYSLTPLGVVSPDEETYSFNLLR